MYDLCRCMQHTHRLSDVMCVSMYTHIRVYIYTHLYAHIYIYVCIVYRYAYLFVNSLGHYYSYSASAKKIVDAS